MGEFIDIDALLNKKKKGDSILDIFYDKRNGGDISGPDGVELPVDGYNACASCYGRDITIVPVNGGDKVRFYGTCNTCGASSPMGENFYLARKKWQDKNK